MAIHHHPWKFDFASDWKPIAGFLGVCIVVAFAVNAVGLRNATERFIDPHFNHDNYIEGFVAHCERGEETALDYFRDPTLNLHTAFGPDGKPLDEIAAKRHPGKGVVVWYQFSVTGPTAKYSIKYRLARANGKKIYGDAGDVDVTSQEKANVSHQFFIMPVPSKKHGDQVTVYLSAPGFDERMADAEMASAVLQGVIAWR